MRNIILTSSEGLVIQMKMNRLKKLSQRVKDFEPTESNQEYISRAINEVATEISEIMQRVRNQHVTLIPEHTLTDEQKQLLNNQD